jgi:hypothetical protein
MTITVLLDPAQMPDQSQDQLDFDNKMSGLMRDLPIWGAQANATEANMSAAAAGGAYALTYTFDAATADADPGAGKLRLSSATQSAATVMRLDLTAGGQDYTKQIDTMDSSTSVIKGSIRLVKQGDLSKWMMFDVTARAAPTGYRNLTVVCTDSSAANPFAAGDALMLFFQRNGDRGQPGANGMLALASATISSPVATIDFLNICTADYDKYTIEIEGLRTTSGGAFLRMSMAVAGAVATVGHSGPVPHNSNLSTFDSFFAVATISSGSAQAVTLTLELRNANSSTPKSLGVRGVGLSSDYTTPIALIAEGAFTGTSAVSGFRLIVTAGTFAAGTIRVFGHRNS